MELINENLIVLDANLRSKEEVINSICDQLIAEDRLSDRQLYLNDVYERENVIPTSLGFSFAIPHAKSDGVKVASLVFIKLKNEIDWTETEKVKFIFGIGVPLAQSGVEHLSILSKLARKMMDEDFRNGLNYAKTKQDYLTLITSDL